MHINQKETLVVGNEPEWGLSKSFGNAGNMFLHVFVVT